GRGGSGGGRGGGAAPGSGPLRRPPATTGWSTRGMPPPGWAPPSPPSRSTARSTDTVVWVRAISTMGWPAVAASSRAWRTTSASSLSAGIACPALISLPGITVTFRRPALEDPPHPGLVADQVQREGGMPWYIPVADEHGDVGGYPFGAECGRA